MSRDKSTTTEPTTKPTLASMFEMLNDLEDDTVITGLPPTTASFVRTPRPDTPIADLIADQVNKPILVDTVKVGAQVGV